MPPGAERVFGRSEEEDRPVRLPLVSFSLLLSVSPGFHPRVGEDMAVATSRRAVETTKNGRTMFIFYRLLPGNRETRRAMWTAGLDHPPMAVVAAVECLGAFPSP